MNIMQVKVLRLVRRFARAGVILGLGIFLCNFFANGLMQQYLLFIGLSIIGSSMLVFGFGLFLSLMEEAGSKKQWEPNRGSWRDNRKVNRKFSVYHSTFYRLDENNRRNSL